MVIIRPTAQLAKRMGVTLNPSSTTSSTRLGDWYAAPLVIFGKQLIVAISEHSRLAVVMRAAPYATFPDRLRESLAEVLTEMGIPREMIESELNEMHEIQIAKTASRSVLGQLTDYRHHIEAMAYYSSKPVTEMLAMSLSVSEMPLLNFKGKYAQQLAIEQFSLKPKPPLRLVTG